MHHPSAAPQLHGAPSGDPPPAPGVGAGASPWRIWLPVALLFLVLDLSFPLYFWQIPKLSSSGFDFGYQFALDEHQLRLPKSDGATRVLAFGSSIAGSFDAPQIEGLLQPKPTDPAFDVHRLMLPGIHPSEYLLLFQNQPMPAPDVVLVMVNLVDFLYPAAEREVNPTLRYIIPPTALWRARRADLSFPDQLELGLSSVSNLYRYRKLIRSCVQDHFRALRRWARHPAPSPWYGVHQDGYTERRFGLPLTEPAAARFFIDPDWIRQRGRAQLRFFSNGLLLAERTFTEPGMKHVELDLPTPSALVDVVADGVWTPRAGDGSRDDVRLLAAQLPPRQDSHVGVPPFRWQQSEPGDIEPLLRLDGRRGPDFEKAWQDLLDSDTRFGQRFRLYRDAKLAIRDRPFVVSEDYAAIEGLVAFFRARGSRVVLVNTPESPLILGQYEDSPYYRAYLTYFRGVAGRTGADFYDLSPRVPAENFNDWHHLNYIGTLHIGRTYAEIITHSLALRAQAPVATP